METHCLLEIHSRTTAELPVGILSKRALAQVEFVDNESQERKEQRRRLAAKGVSINPRLARYWWTLSSQGRIAVPDLSLHLIWLLRSVKPGIGLTDLNKKGFQYALSAYWSGNGLGGGPTITPKAAELMALHSATLDISFYAIREE